MNKTAVAPNPLGTEKIGKLMVRYAIPSVISFVVNSLYNMVDQVFIGQGVGYLGNAATNVTLPIATVGLAFGLMLGDGSAAFMSLSLGRKKPEEAAKGVGAMVSLSVIFSLILTVLGFLLLEPMCHVFGATEGSLPYALSYGSIIILGFPFFLFSAAAAGVIRADGRPRESTIGLIIGCVTNIILDPIFILVFNWGVKGAALATIIGQALNAAYSAYCLLRFKTISFGKKDLLPGFSVCRRVCSLGASSFITQIAAVAIIAVINNMMVYCGAASKYGPDIPLAVFGITMKVSQLAFGISLGIATSAQPILGYNYGSGQYDRVRRTFKLSFISSILVMVAAFAAFQLFPRQITALFGRESELYMEFAVDCFRIFLCTCAIQPVSMVISIFFQSIGKPLPATILSLSRQIIFMIPSALILGSLFGIDGMLLSGPVPDVLSAVTALVVLVFYWKRIFPKEV